MIDRIGHRHRSRGVHRRVPIAGRAYNAAARRLGANAPHESGGLVGMIFNTPERVAALTPQWTGERLPDGRPRVAEDILDRMTLVTSDEAWGVLERRNNYHYQFE